MYVETLVINGTQANAPFPSKKGNWGLTASANMTIYDSSGKLPKCVKNKTFSADPSLSGQVGFFQIDAQGNDATFGINVIPGISLGVPTTSTYTPHHISGPFNDCCNC